MKRGRTLCDASVAHPLPLYRAKLMPRLTSFFDACRVSSRRTVCPGLCQRTAARCVYAEACRCLAVQARFEKSDSRCVWISPSAVGAGCYAWIGSWLAAGSPMLVSLRSRSSFAPGPPNARRPLASGCGVPERTQAGRRLPVSAVRSLIRSESATGAQRHTRTRRIAPSWSLARGTDDSPLRERCDGGRIMRRCQGRWEGVTDCARREAQADAGTGTPPGLRTV